MIIRGTYGNGRGVYREIMEDGNCWQPALLGIRERKDMEEKAFLPRTQYERKKAQEDELESRDGEGAKLTRGGEKNGREERKQEDERASSISPTW